MAQRDADELRAIARWNPIAVFGRAVLDFLNRLGRHWFMLLVLLGGVCLAIRGTILLDYGVAFLFREDTPLHGFAPATLLQSPSFITELFAMLLAGAAWAFAVDLDSTQKEVRSIARAAGHLPAKAAVQTGFHNQLVRLGIRIFLLGIPPFLALVYPASSAIPAVQGEQLIRAALGWLIGFGLTLTVLSVADLIEGWFKTFSGEPGRDAGPKLRQAGGLRGRVERWVDWDNLIWRVIILWLMYVVTWVAMIALVIKDHPAVAIFALAGLILAGYVALNFLVERMRFYAVVGVLALAAVAHRGDAYGYHFPGWQSHYTACAEEVSKGQATSGTALTPHWCGKPDMAALGQAASLASADSSELMNRPVRLKDSLRGFKEWQRSQRSSSDARLPKLVVVAISGGAYRAAFWGALVLDRLRLDSGHGKRLEGFAQSIRLLTGASGGMVPAAYFVMLDPDDISQAGTASLVDQISRDIAKPGDPLEPHSRDSLSPITQQLVQHDLFNVFSPWPPQADRGTALERQWKTLDKTTFTALRREEEAGRRASLIFAPMIAETGQPLLISNLDLSQISRPESLQTLELFRALPEAANELKLSTAVRMSATFPLVTPPASLPTRPALHVLDAGYLDNYGMGIVLAYLKQPDVLEWVSANTAGVILVQINAFPATPAAVAATGKTCHDASTGVTDDWVSRALSQLTSPLSGLFSSRGASMRFRNDQEFDTLRQLMAAGPGGKPVNLDRVVFENTARASFSWYLPQQDLDCMHSELETAGFKDQLDKLARYWKAEPVAAARIQVPAPADPVSPGSVSPPGAGPATTASTTPLAAGTDDDPVPPEPAMDAMPTAQQ